MDDSKKRDYIRLRRQPSELFGGIDASIFPSVVSTSSMTREIAAFPCLYATSMSFMPIFGVLFLVLTTMHCLVHNVLVVPACSEQGSGRKLNFWTHKKRRGAQDRS